MDVLSRYTLAFALMALSLPAISYGASAGVAVAWGVGLAMLFVGGLVPPAVRFAAADPDAI
ncbi:MULTISPECIES: hypothetical protein [Halorubrum]|uniref:Uncharacterized protein n=1 Tax=Halorubrum hochstenium ATCC 700873 TaxID=1227481 RepID=M0FB44_9EURY|nr:MULTISPECIES: hypothetical protein [Halorubrum]ELZ56442.1 hypothetical protein C467_08125 [Halorubrum hochstenium ATCC 700873]